MARPLRIQYPGAFYHITARGNERKAVYNSTQDRKQFLLYLESAHKRYGAIIHAYCLMGNHYHLLLETPRENLSQVMHHINGAYTTYYNIKRRRSGHLFQSRYKAILVEKDAYCQELSRYIHLNPLRAGMVNMVEEYHWSSYQSYIGMRKDEQWLETGYVLGYFGSGKSTARKKYRKYVEEAVGKAVDDPSKLVYASTILGGASFISWVQNLIKEEIKGSKKKKDVPALKGLAGKPSLDRIQEVVTNMAGSDSRMIKKMCLYVSQCIAGYSLSEIGERCGMEGAAVSQSNRRFKEKITRDEKIKRLLDEIKAMLNVEA